MRSVSGRGWFLVLLAGALALVVIVWPGEARAAGEKSVAVLIEGGESDSVEADVAKVLPPELRVIDDKTFAEALRRAGHSGQFGNAIAVKGALRDRMLARAVKAIETTGASAAILGRVRIGKLGKEVWIVWLSANGDVAVDEAVSLRGSADETRSALRSALSAPASALLPSASAAPEIAPAASDKPRDTADPDPPPAKPAKTHHYHATELFEVGAAFELGGRHVEFTDPVTQNIRPYDVLGVPMIAVSGAVYPAARTGIPVLKDLGITARFAAALGLTSSTKSGNEGIDTTWLRFRGGLRWRFVPGTEKGPVLALTGDFGLDTFTFANAGALAGSVPSVEYTYLRAGGDVRLPIGPIAIDLGGGYRGLLGVGETGDRFSKGSALAFDAFVGLAAVCPMGFEIRLSGDYTRVFYAFQPTRGDAYVAGGAVDEMLGARLGVAYLY